MSHSPNVQQYIGLKFLVSEDWSTHYLRIVICIGPFVDDLPRLMKMKMYLGSSGSWGEGWSNDHERDTVRQHGSWSNMDPGTTWILEAMQNLLTGNTLSANYQGQLAKNMENKKLGTWKNVFHQVISASGRLNGQVTRKCPLSINITPGVHTCSRYSSSGNMFSEHHFTHHFL